MDEVKRFLGKHAKVGDAGKDKTLELVRAQGCQGLRRRSDSGRSTGKRGARKGEEERQEGKERDKKKIRGWGGKGRCNGRGGGRREGIRRDSILREVPGQHSVLRLD